MKLTGAKRNPNASKVNKLNQFGETPLHTACIAGNIAQVERLIEQNAPLNARDHCGWTPLHEACNHGHVEIVEYLIKNGADIEACDERSELITPLHDSCSCGHLSIIRLLLRSGANVLALNANNETPVECLMSWFQRTENELSKDVVDEYIALEKEILTAMKDKGYDLFKSYNKISSNSLSQAANEDVPLVKRQRNLVGLDIYLDKDENERSHQTQSNKCKNVDFDDPEIAVNEYRIAMDKLRRTHLVSRLSKLESRNKKDTNALVEEDEVAPKDDWLINDIGQPNKKTKKRSQVGHFESNRKKQKYDSLGEASNSKSQIDESSDEGEESVEFFSSQSSNLSDRECEYIPMRSALTTTIECVDGENSSQTVHLVENESTSQTLSMKSNGEDLDLSESQSNALDEDGENKVIIVRFDDEEKSTFAIPLTENSFSFRELAEQVTQRYFRRYSVKPIVSLHTLDGAILSEHDLITDFITEKPSFKAVIESWIIEPAPTRYSELCQQNSVQPNQELIDAFHACTTNSTFNISHAFIASREQTTLMFKSLCRQDVKEMNLSSTSFMSNKANIECLLNTLTTIPTLQVLNLSCTAFPKKYLINLLNLSPILKRLDLSFNSIGDENVYTVSQIITVYDKLCYLNLSGCDFTEKLVKSKLMISAIEASNLNSLQLDYNGIERELVSQFKTLNIDKSFLAKLSDY